MPFPSPKEFLGLMSLVKHQNGLFGAHAGRGFPGAAPQDAEEARVTPPRSPMPPESRSTAAAPPALLSPGPRGGRVSQRLLSPEKPDATTVEQRPGAAFQARMRSVTFHLPAAPQSHMPPVAGPHGSPAAGRQGCQGCRLSSFPVVQELCRHSSLELLSV